MEKISKEAWNALGEARFGKNYADWRWICPCCGRVNSGSEFIKFGESPTRGATICIGRVNGKGVSGMGVAKKDRHCETGCDWAAGGISLLTETWSITPPQAAGA